jgi:hypothetical protein
MSDSPFTQSIRKNTEDSHQASPAYVITFVRWANRDPVNYQDPQNPNTDPTQQVRDPLVVISDCINLNVSNSKSGLSSSCTATLLAGEINYSTAVHPGDYMIVNMLNYESDAVKVAQKALAQQSINKYEDGFKGVYKIQKVRRRLTVNPESGTKQVAYTVHAFGFTELNTVIYYNPAISEKFASSDVLFIAQFADFWSQFATSKDNTKKVQIVLKYLIKAILGKGINRNDFTIPATQNNQFIIPQLLGKLLNRPISKVATDIYNFYFGIWSLATGSTNETPGQNFNSMFEQWDQDTNFYKVKGDREMQGWRLLAAENWNFKQIWSILGSYLNGAINEMYTTYRVGPDNFVYPSIIARQKPFSSDHFLNPNRINNVDNLPAVNTAHTKFSSIPRWRISPDLLYDIDLGKDEASRVNFVQVFGRSIAASDQENQASQIGLGNFFFNPIDVKRHGLKPSVITTEFDFPGGTGENVKQSRAWAYLLFDMMYAGELRESGTLTFYGIQDPISVGDNIEFDNNIYHIESVNHILQIAPDGKKLFRTSLTLSFGTSLDSDSTAPVYPQMENTFSDNERSDDYSNERILPGNSDTQDIPYDSTRKDGEKIRDGVDKSFTLDENVKPRISSIEFQDDGSSDNKKKKGKK